MINSAAARLKESGLRVTSQRELVLNALEQIKHGTPDEILVEVHRIDSGVNLSTIYRCLETLENSKLVTHTHLGHGANTYHVVDSDPHLHLQCSKCDSVQSIPIASAAQAIKDIENHSGFKVDPNYLTLDGLCVECKQAG
jgi:Fur family ferric uptake transcriptional regulator